MAMGGKLSNRGGQGGNFFKEFLDDPYFVLKSIRKYWDMRGWLYGMVADGGLLDQYADKLAHSAVKNDELWGWFLRANFGERSRTANEDQTVIKQYFIERLAWLDQQFSSLDSAMGSVKTAYSAHPYTKSSLIDLSIEGSTVANSGCSAGGMGADVVLQVSGDPVVTVRDRGVAAATADFYVNGRRNKMTVPFSEGMATVAVSCDDFFTDPDCPDLVSVICRDEAGESVATTYLTVWCDRSAFDVALEFNGGSLVEGTKLDRYIYGTETPLPTAATVSRRGYDFAGWYDNAELIGEPVVSIDANESGEKAYWAKWTPSVYSVVLHAGDSAEVTEALDSYTFGQGARLPGALCDGYDFCGWFANGECAGDPVTEIGTDETGNMEYWAKWSPAVYPVTLYAGDDSEISPLLDSYVFGQGAELPWATRKGYLFRGWYDNKELSGNASVAIAPDEMGAKEYWAKWERNFSISVGQGLGGTVITNKTSALPGERVLVSIVPNKGYEVYVALLMDGSGGLTPLATNSFVMPASDVAIAAYFKVSRQSMYRAYNPNSGEHFYTADSEEFAQLKGLGWHDEGIGWIAPAISDVPVYRLYNPNAGDHHYTRNSVELDMLVDAGWNDEGVGWYSDSDEAMPVFREYNPNEPACNHNYTTSFAEHSELVALGWQSEGIGWFGVV